MTLSGEGARLFNVIMTQIFKKYSLEVSPKTELSRKTAAIIVQISFTRWSFLPATKHLLPVVGAHSRVHTRNLKPTPSFFSLAVVCRTSLWVPETESCIYTAGAWEEDYSFSIQESYLPIAKKRYPSNFCLLRGHAFFVAATCKVTRNLRLLPHREYIRGHFQTINVIMTPRGGGG